MKYTLGKNFFLPFFMVKNIMFELVRSKDLMFSTLKKFPTHHTGYYLLPPLKTVM